MKRFLHDNEPLGQSMAEPTLDPAKSVLIAQVKQADASHRMDLSSSLLRSKHFNAPHKVVYLGNVAATLLAQLPHPETPEMKEAPGFNEQRWTLVTQSGDITVHIASRSYWAFGLFNSGYLNVITLTGPVRERARIMFDTMSALGHKPWEFSHTRSAQKWLSRLKEGQSTKENERNWLAHRSRAKADLQEQIERLKQRSDVVFAQFEGEDLDSLHNQIDHELHMAKEALHDENAPGLERALARAEAELIAIDPRSSPVAIDAPAEILASPDDILDVKESSSMDEMGRIVPVEPSPEEVPFVDLTSSSHEEE
tara:strand:- start:53183 stop:54115 length:933 start_codon:yes stop_codon:yes gene_type:complete